MSKREDLERRRARLAARQSKLTDKQKSLLAKRKERTSISPETIPQRDPESVVPLSFSQQRLFFLDRLQGASVTYNMPLVVRIEGKTDLEALQQALCALAERHEALRTHVGEQDGRAYQVISEAQPVELEPFKVGGKLPTSHGHIELTELPLETREAAALEIFEQLAQIPFELTDPPLWRVVIAELTTTRLLVYLNMHHIISDGWTLGVVMRDLAALYQLAAAGKTPRLAPLPVQFGDYAVWQRSQETKLRELVDWWTELLGKQPAPLQLPLDRARPAIQSTEGETHAFLLPPELGILLEHEAREHEATLYMILLSAFGMLLHHYSGQNEILLGSPVANRERAELEGLVGFFVNTVVVPIPVSNRASTAELLQATRKIVTEVFAHQEVPFDWLIDALEIPRDMSVPPLVQVSFSFQTMPLSTLAMPGLKLTPVTLANRVSRFDLSLSINRREDGLFCNFEYASALFEAATIRRMGQHFANLLRAMVSDPQRPMAELPLMDEAERRTLLTEFQTRPERTEVACFYQRFEAAARRHAGRTALCGPQGQKLTYAQLETRAIALATLLHKLGVRPGDAVGMFLKRGVEQIISLLAVAHRGGFLVPIDPLSPPDRVAFTVTDSAIRLLLSADAPEGLKCHTVDPSFDLKVPTDAPASVALPPEALAYAIYTSGSTGRPKGVGVAQSALSNLEQAMGQRVLVDLNVSEGLRCGLNASMSFDVSVYQWLQLAAGHTVFIVPEEIRGDGRQLAGWIESHRIELFDCTPTHMRLLLPELKAGTAGKTLFMIAGEAIDSAMWAGLLQLDHSRFFNIYGPTEACVYALAARPSEHPALPVIGRPLPQYQAYACDTHGRLRPYGVPGELWLGGPGLAQGYLGRPSLTAERFVPDAFGGTGARLYRTGDLVRLLPSGQFAYEGRIDHQVKLRGLRIELGEIEARLLEHDSIAQAVAIVRDDENQPYLAAYVVPAGETADTAELQAFVASRLPAYMVPRSWMVLPHLPVNASGKLDRRRLPKPELLQRADTYVAPRNETEKQLCDIWASVLEQERVGIDDNFFSLGGDSMLSLQVMSRARDRGLVFDLQTMFRNQTIRLLAEALVRGGSADRETVRPPFSLLSPETVSILDEDVTDAWPVSRTQQMMLNHAHDYPESPMFREISSLLLRYPLDTALLTRAWNDLIVAHPVLRSSFGHHGGELVQLVHEKVAGSFTLLDWSDRDDAQWQTEIEAWQEAELRQLFRWNEAPLVRFFIHRRDVERFQFTMHFPRALLDGWSQATLRTELLAHYAALLAGKPSIIPPASAGGTELVRLEKQARTSPATREFWLEVMDGYETLPLPREGAGSRPYGLPEPLAKHIHYLDIPLSNQIKALSESEGVPIKSIMLAAHFRTMAALGGKADLFLGLQMNNRPESVEGERLLGMFQAEVPIRYHLGEGSWNAFVRGLQKTETDLLAHRRLPLEDLMDMGDGRRFFHVLFIYSHFHVYRQLDDADMPEILDRHGVDLYPYPLVVGANVDVNSDHIRLTFDFADDFEPGRIALLAGWYERALRFLVTEWDEPYLARSLMDGDEFSALSAYWNEPYTSLTTDFRFKQVQELSAATSHWQRLVLGETRDPLLPGIPGRLFLGNAMHVEAFTNQRPLPLPPIETELAACLQKDRDLVPVMETSRSERMAQPLTPPQKRVWFTEKMTGPSPQYNITQVHRLSGPLSPADFGRAVAEVVMRHDSLRTNFMEINGMPVPIVATDPDHYHFRYLDFTGLPQPLAAAQSVGLEEAGHCFRLDREPLCRCHLFRLDDNVHILLLVFHHIIFDGWSANVFMQDLATIYGARLRGTKLILPKLEIDYGTYARRLKRSLAPEVVKEQLAYWRRKLTNLPFLIMPTDRPRKPTRSTLGHTLMFMLPDDIVAGMRRLNDREGTTPFMVVLSAYTMLLSRYVNQNDIIVGTPVANRNQGRLWHMIGYFANTLALRNRVFPEDTPRTLLTRVRAETLDAFSHAEIPFEHLVEELKPPRIQGQIPIIQAMFAFQNVVGKEGDLKLPGLHGEPVIANNELQTRFDILFEMAEVPDGIQGVLEYVVDLFDRETIERYKDHLILLLRFMVEQPDEPFRLQSLLDAPQQQQLMRWNQTGIEGPAPTLLPQLPEQGRAEALALEQIDEQGQLVASLTYGELQARTIGLAERLVGRTSGTEAIIAIMITDPIQRFIAVQAILLSGGVVLPLDAAWPASRQARILADAQPEWVLADAPGAQILPETCDAVLIEALTGSERAQLPQLERNQAAYLIYTSGSTGLPKGILVSHDAIANQLAWTRRAYPSNPATRLLQLASLSFDIAFWEHYAPLSGGGTVVFPPVGCQSDAQLILELVQRVGITHLHVVPSLLQALMAHRDASQKLEGLKHLFCGGEELSAELARRVCGSLSLPFHHLYGPTEAAINATSWEVSEFTSLGRVCLGRPIDQHTVYLLDPFGNPLPPGIPGELCIGGKSLARGYVGQPALTAQRFIPDPFGEAGSRLFRTGDRATFLRDGRLWFGGRIDFQIKLRGIRIHPAEIEHSMHQFEGVEETVVMGRGEQLAAWYTTSAQVEQQKLRAHLKRNLPEYMVPHFLVQLPELPLLPNGKIDRAAMPEPVAVSEETGPHPRTSTEELVAEIWAQMLGLPHVGVTENFFDLGGHSLLAARVVARIRSSFGVEPPLKLFFEDPTVAAMAHYIDTHEDKLAEVFPLKRSVRAEAPLSPSQWRLWFLYKLEGPTPTYNMPFALQLRGRLDVAALERALLEVQERHDILRASFIEEDQKVVQRFDDSLAMPLFIEDYVKLTGSEREAVANGALSSEIAYCFDLAHGPLFRARLLRLETDRHLLLINVHHIIFDGWSLGVLVSEISAAYRAFVRDDAPQLPPLNLQFGDYTTWQARVLNDAELKRRADFWMKYLEDAPPFLDLPTDKHRPALQSFHGSGYSTLIPPDQRDRLDALAREARMSLFLLLMAGFNLLLARISGSRDIVIGTPVANRARHELEHLIGFFVNTVVVRTEVSEAQSVTAFLEHVRTRGLDALAHADMPFDKLVELLQPERDLSRAPVFQVMFAMQNVPMEAPENLPGLAISRLEGRVATAKFDLSLSVTESDEGLLCEWEYATDLFAPATVERLAELYRGLLQAMANSPEQELTRIDLLGEPMRRQILETFNPDYEVAPIEHCLHQRFERMVEANPEKTALDGEEQHTYEALERQANQLAHQLLALGVQPGHIVAILLAPSSAQVVAQLAVLKTGAAYLPLDTAYPAGRIHFSLIDSGVAVLITTADNLAECEVPRNVLPVCLNSQAQRLASFCAARPRVPVGPESLAYVMYTSGSTGDPKGVCVHHRQVMHLFHSSEAEFELGRDDRVLYGHSYAFDVAVWEMWAALAFGGRLVVVPRRVIGDPVALDVAIRTYAVTVLCQTPSSFSRLVELIEPGDTNLRLILFAGEALDFQLLREWITRHGDRQPRIYNLYGITETTIYSTCRRITEADVDTGNSLIGQGFPGMPVYVLDPYLRPVPIGVRGEIHLAGCGLTQGYHQDPKLTASRFLPNPFSPIPGQRLYRGGDLGCHLANGDIAFLGRLDFQIKLRGYRVEPGEIEARLIQHPHLRTAVVVPNQQANGTQLIAYVVPTVVEAPGVGALRAWLGERLPEFMIPALFVTLERLPTTPNGKVDRQRLPKPETTRSGLEGYVPPETQLQRLLTGIWAEVLDVPRVGLDDNFFTLGGDSLRSTRVLALARRRGLNMNLQQLFQQQTVRQLAAWLEAEGKGDVVFPMALPRVREFWVSYLYAAQPANPPQGEGTISRRKLPQHLRLDLQKLARSWRIELSWLLLAAFARMLSIENKNERVLFGVHGLGRDADPILPLRIGTEARTWHELVTGLREAHGAAYPHRHTDLGRVSRLLELPELYRVTFIIGKGAMPKPGMRITFVEHGILLEATGSFAEHASLERFIDQVRQLGGRPEAPLRRVGPPRKMPNTFPLSIGQERMVNLYRKVGKGPYMNMGLARLLRGPLDADALNRAQAMVLVRHEQLRANFIEREEGLVTQIRPVPEQPLRVIDLADLDAETQERVARQIGIAELGHAFDLAHEPLARLNLVRLGEDRHLLLVLHHHAVTDGWSSGIYQRDLMEAYVARVLGRPPSWPVLALTYREFAEQQRIWLSGSMQRRQIDYWLETLAGVSGAIDLPLDYPRGAAIPTVGGAQPLNVPEDLHAGLMALGREEGASLFMILMTAFQAMLVRVTGQRDLVVGTPVANRHRTELWDMVGLFIDGVPIRGQIDEQMSLRGLLRQIKTRALEGFEHQDTPFSRIVEALHIPTTENRMPVFQTMVSLQNTGGAPDITPPGTEAELIEETISLSSRYELTLEMAENNHGLMGALQYPVELFRAETVAGWRDLLLTIMERLATDPDSKVSGS